MAKPNELTLQQSLNRANYKPNLAPHKMWLTVPWADKDQAKALGAKWDATRCSWYIPADTDMGKFKQWSPKP